MKLNEIKDESTHDSIENELIEEDLQWSENGPPKHWASSSSSSSPNKLKGIKDVAVLPCSLLVKFDKHNTALEVIKNTERVVENISIQLRSGFNFPKCEKKKNYPKNDSNINNSIRKRNQAIATTIGIVGVATTAIGISLLVGGPLTAGWGIAAAADTAAKSATIAATTAAGTTAVEGSVAAAAATAAAGGAAVAAASVGMIVVQTFHSTNGKKRLIVLGKKKGGCNKVGIVRPNIIIDGEWDDIVTEIIKFYAPSFQRTRNNHQHHNGPKLLRRGLFMNGWLNNKKDADIKTSRLEQREKMFLLIARGLNDKTSALSIVYKKLIVKLRERAFNRLVSSDCKRDDGDRSIRQDVHAIIKHITAILIEERPEFGCSVALTEISASCVESLVLSEVYDVVFEEIISQTREEDQNLQEKIRCYHHSMNNPLKIFSFIQSRNDDGDVLLCGEAIEALQMIPSCRTVQTKLDCCADVLKAISDHGVKRNLSADRLLESVCHHIVHARVPHLNAQCLFLEEFASDDQLVRGVEGYALITLLASLSYLNNCDRIET